MPGFASDFPTPKPAPAAAADPISQAFAADRRARLSAHEVSVLLSVAARLPAVYLAARPRLESTLFEASEGRFVLFWRGVCGVADAHGGRLPGDALAAKELVAARCSAELANDPARMFYTPAVEQAVLSEGGLVDAAFAFPVDAPQVEEYGYELLARFVTERVIADPLRRHFAGLAGTETLSDPLTLVRAVEAHAREIVGIGVDPGGDAVVDSDDWCPAGAQTVPTQIPWLDELLNGGHAAKETYVLLAPTGGGKCLGRDTPVLMYDGTTKMVQDVVVGDRLMGPDSTPRTVRSTCSGRENLYRVVQTKGESYVVNESHILSLKLTPTSTGQAHERIDICVRDYLRQSRTFKHRAKGWRTGVEWASRAVPLDPYFLGIWLGDGTQTKAQVSKPDPEIRDAVAAVGEAMGLVMTDQSGRDAACPSWTLTTGVRGGRPEDRQNGVLNALRELGVVAEKHVPECYLVNDRKTRLAVLAGLLDTDGSLKHHGRGYEYPSSNPRLADDAVFLARSLGFLVTKVRRVTKCQTGATCVSWRLQISGNVDEIPCRVAKKKALPRRKRRDHLVTGIRLEPLGEGDYYGFEIDGDRLFLLGDFTVTHNTALAVQVAIEGATLQAAVAAEAGPEVAGHWYYFTWELNRQQMQERVYSYGARVSRTTLNQQDPRTRKPVFSSAADPTSLKPYEHEPYVNSPGNPLMGERERIVALRRRLAGPHSRLVIVDYSGEVPGQGLGGVEEVAAYLRREEARGRRVAGVVLDYAGLAVSRLIGHRKLRPEAEYPLLNGFGDAVRNQVAIPFNCPAWVLHQFHGDATKRAAGARMHHSEARGARNFADNADFALGIAPYNKLTGMTTVNVSKHRRTPGREDGAIVRFDGRFGAFLSPERDYVIDPISRQIVPKDFLDVLPTGPAPSPARARSVTVDPTQGV